MVMEDFDEARRQAETAVYVREAFANYEVNNMLTGEILALVAMYSDSDFAAEAKRDLEVVQKTVQAFKANVWTNGGLQRQVASMPKAASYCGDLGVTTETFGNKTLIHMQDKATGANISLLGFMDQSTPEEEFVMGIQSIKGTVAGVVGLIGSITLLSDACRVRMAPLFPQRNILPLGF